MLLRLLCSVSLVHFCLTVFSDDLTNFPLPPPNASITGEASALACFDKIDTAPGHVLRYCVHSAETSKQMNFTIARTFPFEQLNQTKDNATKEEGGRICRGYRKLLSCVNKQACRRCSYNDALDMDVWESNSLRWINASVCLPAGKPINPRRVKWCQLGLTAPSRSTTDFSEMVPIVCIILVTTTLFIVVVAFTIHWFFRVRLVDTGDATEQLTTGVKANEKTSAEAKLLSGEVSVKGKSVVKSVVKEKSGVAKSQGLASALGGNSQAHSVLSKAKLGGLKSLLGKSKSHAKSSSRAKLQAIKSSSVGQLKLVSSSLAKSVPTKKESSSGKMEASDSKSIPNIWSFL